MGRSFLIISINESNRSSVTKFQRFNFPISATNKGRINMGNSSTKLAEKCSLLSRDEVPVVASSFKFVSKNSERIKEDDLMVKTKITIPKFGKFFEKSFLVCSRQNRNSGALKWIHGWHNTLQISFSVHMEVDQMWWNFNDLPNCTCFVFEVQ